jgi:pimeloyl-ACP methyl ester carboxylesterase
MRRKWFYFLPAVLVLFYMAGPHPSRPAYSLDLPLIADNPATIEHDILSDESHHHLKSDNEARIVWSDDSTKEETDYCIVYLHGFSASQKEGDPIHRNIAAEFGCNLYLSRLAEHGIDTSEQLVNLTADKYWESAKKAMAIGRKLGKKLILMGTSTGASLALQLAADFPKDVAALILLSPNISINDPFAWILNDPWGLQVARFVKHGKYMVADDDRPLYRKYWNKPYRLEAAVALEEYLETAMIRENFRDVKQPVLLLYYYKDKIHQDSVVKVSAMLEMFDELGTPADQKRKLALPNTGDHVIGSPIKSRDVAGVQKEIESFLIDVLAVPRRIDKGRLPGQNSMRHYF